MKNKGGFSVVELLLGAAILSVFLGSIYGYFVAILRASNETTRYIQSAYLLEEGVEAVKSMRDAGYTAQIKNLDKTKTYSLLFTSGAWVATTTPEMVDGIFTRTVKFDKAYRDGSSNLALAGTEDTNTTKITLYVSWRGASGATSTTVTASTYVQNIFQN